jgi:hypothetical protein
MKRELWRDYDESWTVTATSFAVNIDQWYAAIAHGNPNSVYWNERTSDRSFVERMNSFEWLIGADVTGDLIPVMTRGSGRLSVLPESGALMQSLRTLLATEPRDDVVLRLRHGVTIQRSMTISTPDGRLPDPWSHGRYWLDPLNCANEVSPIYGTPVACFRFQNGDDTPRVRFLDETCGRELFAALRLGRNYGELRLELPPTQWDLLLRLVAANLVYTC